MGGTLWCYGTQEGGCTNHSFIHLSASQVIAWLCAVHLVSSATWHALLCLIR
jgi:hypothetical protein